MPMRVVPRQSVQHEESSSAPMAEPSQAPRRSQDEHRNTWPTTSTRTGTKRLASTASNSQTVASRPLVRHGAAYAAGPHSRGGPTSPGYHMGHHDVRSIMQLQGAMQRWQEVAHMPICARGQAIIVHRSTVPSAMRKHTCSPVTFSTVTGSTLPQRSQSSRIVSSTSRAYQEP